MDLTLKSGNSPEVSIIVPNYNHGRYLRQRIDSVLNQTFKNFEVIILDDCSTDESRIIIESYKEHPQITQIVFNTLNTGSPFLQWKKGIEMARGTWIWIAESDDWCEATFLETVLTYTDEGTVISNCQSMIVNQEDAILWETNSGKLIDKWNGEVFFKKNLKDNLIINASMAIFRRSIYESIEKHFLKYRYIGDWVFWCELSLKGNIVVSGKKLNYFRKHPLDVHSKAIVSGAWYYEKLKAIDQFSSFGLINDAEKKKVISHSYKDYCLSGSSIAKEHRGPLVKEYYSRLGSKLYFIYARLLCLSLLKKIASSVRVFLNK